MFGGEVSEYGPEPRVVVDDFEEGVLCGFTGRIFLVVVVDEAAAKVVKSVGPNFEVDEYAVELGAIACGFFNKVDVVDDASGIALGNATLAEDGADATFLDVGEYARDAEGRFVGSERFNDRTAGKGCGIGVNGLGSGTLGRSSRRLICGHVS